MIPTSPLIAMRPWIIVTGDLAPHGGMDRANFELARRLLAEGRTVHLVSHRVADPLPASPNAVVHLVPRPGGRHLLGGFFLNRAGKTIARSLSAERPIVVVNGGNCRMPAVNWVHYLFARCKNQNQGAPLLFRLRNRFARFRGLAKEASAFHQAKLLIANSGKTRRELMECFNLPAERIETVYLGIDPDQVPLATPFERDQARATLGVSGDCPVILFVGVLGYDRNKGFDTLLEAFPKLDPSARLFAIGNGRLESWRRLADATGAGDRIILLGPRSDVPKLMAGADLFVSPTRYDSYGLAVQEAICRGIPAIVSSTAGVSERYPPDLARDLMLADPNDADELARKITAALQNRKAILPKVASLGDELRGWTWNDMAGRMIEVIERSTAV